MWPEPCRKGSAQRHPGQHPAHLVIHAWEYTDQGNITQHLLAVQRAQKCEQMAQRTQPWTVSRMTLIKSHHWIHFQHNPIPMKYHFSNAVTLLERKWLQGTIMPGLSWLKLCRWQRLSQSRRDLPSIISSWAGPDQISPITFFTYDGKTGRQVTLRTSFPSLTLITRPTFPPHQIKRGRVEENLWRRDRENLLLYRSEFVSRWNFIYPHIFSNI